MTKEELKDKLISEAQDGWNKLNITKRVCGSEFSYYDGYIDCGFIKEEQIQIDAEQIRALQKQNGELTDELKDLRQSIKEYGAGCYENGLRNGRRKLEAQIEKMKRCEICKHYQGESCNYHSNWVKDCKENGMKLFELKEIKENE